MVRTVVSLSSWMSRVGRLYYRTIATGACASEHVVHRNKNRYKKKNIVGIGLSADTRLVSMNCLEHAMSEVHLGRISRAQSLAHSVRSGHTRLTSIYKKIYFF